MFRCPARDRIVQRVSFASTIHLEHSHVMPHHLIFRGRVLSTARLLRFAAAALFFFSLASPAQAQTYWTLPPGQLGDWSNPSNWDSGVPTSSSYVYIVNGGTVTISLLGEVCGNLYLGEAGDGNSGTIQMTGGFMSDSVALGAVLRVQNHPWRLRLVVFLRSLRNLAGGACGKRTGRSS